jgi:hypothetical protein
MLFHLFLEEHRGRGCRAAWSSLLFLHCNIISCFLLVTADGGCYDSISRPTVFRAYICGHKDYANGCNKNHPYCRR